MIQATLGTQHTEGRQSKQTNNTANRKDSQLKTIQRYRHHLADNTQKDDNQSKGTTQQGERTVNYKQFRDTGNIEHKTNEDKKNKKKYRKLKWQSIINNPEIQATLSTRRNEDKKNKNTVQKTEVAINNKQSRDTGNIGHTTHRRTTMKAKEQHSKQKGKSSINNPEIQATLGTQHTQGRQSKQRNNTANRRESQ